MSEAANTVGFFNNSVENTFLHISRRLESSRNKELTHQEYLALYSIFGETLIASLQILDTKSKIIRYRPDNNQKISLIEVKGNQNKLYRLFENVAYCPCAAFTYQVIINKHCCSCKHILAAKLSNLLGKIEEQIIPIDHFNFLLKQIPKI